MKKKLTVLGMITVLTLSMSSLISAAPLDPIEPQGCSLGGPPRYCDMLQ
ncbi:hypothetical protein HUB98_04000 [Paenibacillus barcinonensis]|uniref:Cyclic lactone autoinducer peptide n=1 Tax=Paenibacillus barcinonensis TaxID=198119 RepID=A0A2V4V9N2_PAEBA|nr:hypothetical protein [Paenibacillus barcinonensis]PYE49351.1 hypothetical protein DFQ00_106337 [Paenibacillus barcinonensis]QKS55561.1 hypothetical protein HUB98_04000 [Paenibacillus barcinonensis]